jgi:hypothetical protein
MDISLIVQQIATLFQQHQPWIADKVAGAAVVQGVKELWDYTKAKLGVQTTQKLEQKPDDAGQWKIFEAKLLLALDEDQAFAKKLGELVAKNSPEPTGISQKAEGFGHKQVAVKESQNVGIRVK